MSLTYNPRYIYRAMLLLAAGFGLLNHDRWVIAPLFPVIMKDLGFDYKDLDLNLVWQFGGG